MKPSLLDRINMAYIDSEIARMERDQRERERIESIREEERLKKTIAVISAFLWGAVFGVFIAIIEILITLAFKRG